MKCSIVQDLLSNYIDGLTSPETAAEIEAHLNECADCRAVYKKMTASLPEEPSPQDKDIDFLKIMKEKIRMKNVLFFLGWLAAAVFFTAFTKTYSIVLPFDAERMSVECFRSAVLINDAGQIQWEALTPDTPGYDEKKAYDNTLRLARLAFRGYFPSVSEMSIGRDIDRDGEQVRVVYYRYTRTLWDSIFIKLGSRESGSSYGTDIYGDSYESADFGSDPQKKEIYYLPVKDLDKIDRLSDQEYDAQKKNAVLVWSGVI